MQIYTFLNVLSNTEAQYTALTILYKEILAFLFLTVFQCLLLGIY